jgi:hypothetical protein
MPELENDTTNFLTVKPFSFHLGFQEVQEWVDYNLGKA